MSEDRLIEMLENTLESAPNDFYDSYEGRIRLAYSQRDALREENEELAAENKRYRDALAGITAALSLAAWIGEPIMVEQRPPPAVRGPSPYDAGVQRTRLLPTPSEHRPQGDE